MMPTAVEPESLYCFMAQPSSSPMARKISSIANMACISSAR
jgi:hypothetical protein